MTKNIYIASDHRGFALKTKFIDWLREQGLTVTDFGPSSSDSVDAMDYAIKVAEAMRTDPHAVGILICMSGQAMTMTANRYKHIRAAMCLNQTMARLARQHNDANVLTMGAYIIGEEVAFDCLRTFLETPFLEGRFTPRRDKLTDLGGL